MFTGIVADVGSVVEILRRETDARLTIATALGLHDAAIGASISCAGVCLTVTDKDVAAGRFSVDVSNETLAKTTLGDLAPGAPINLERALRVGDELGGHIVSGHVDGVATLAAATADGESTRWRVAAPAALSPFIAPKGSVALDGVSLTVNEVDDDDDGAAVFGVNLIPHTKAQTSFGGLSPGARLNLEIDVLARYVARLEEATRRRRTA